MVIQQWLQLPRDFIFLSPFHGIVIIICSLHRVLRAQWLGRKVGSYCQPLPKILHSVKLELVGSGGSVGYREIHQRLRARGIQVDRETIRIIITALDPGGAELRSRHRLRRRKYFARGPN